MTSVVHVMDLLPPGSAIDLDTCAREPIHLPGQVQPHGVLLVVRVADEVVLQVSDNSRELLGLVPEQLLGRTLTDVVGPGGATALRSLLIFDGPPGSESLEVHGLPYEALVYSPEPGYRAVELEPRAPDSEGDDARTLDARWLLNGLQAATSVEGLLQAATRLMREATGYDRVWAYRFQADGHGVIVAEAKTEQLPSFLGLHFPEGDIPAQARALYLRNGIRTIVDTDAAPARVEPVVNPDTQQWTDMSDGALRAVSPMHVTYLRQMGVRASASVALVVDGRLWGLLAAHHYAGPRRLGHRPRALSELLGVLVGMQIDGRQRTSAATALLELQEDQRRVLEAVAGAETAVEGLVADPEALLGLCRASGAVVRAGSELVRVGITPTRSRCEALLDALAAHPDPAFPEVLAISCLATALPELPGVADLAETAAGALVASLSKRHGNLLVWLRPEQLEEVTWGGKATGTPSPQNGVERLTPHGSFETWKQTVPLQCRPWLPEEALSAQQLRSSLGTLLLSRTEALSRANSELLRVNAELDAFAYSAGHDLREPLRGMSTQATFLVEDYGDLLDDKGRERLGRLVSQAARMGTLLDSLLDYATLGRSDLEPADVSVAAIAQDAWELVRSRVEETGAELRQGPDGVLHADATRLLEVLANLFDNALKYNKAEHPVVEVNVVALAATARGEEVVGQAADPFSEAPAPLVVCVSDNGIGIRPEDREVVFDVFRRLHGPGEYSGGSGAGLPIVRRIIERHGGRVWVEDSTGGGTCFCFTVQP
jgi:chemotaxis family two-component system sensor kinase Cph1